MVDKVIQLYHHSVCTSPDILERIFDSYSKKDKIEDIAKNLVRSESLRSDLKLNIKISSTTVIWVVCVPYTSTTKYIPSKSAP